MTWISGTVVERQDKDGFSKIVVEAFRNHYEITLTTDVATQFGYDVGISALVDVTDGGARVLAISRPTRGTPLALSPAVCQKPLSSSASED